MMQCLFIFFFLIGCKSTFCIISMKIMFWNLADQICYLTPPVIHLPPSEVNTTFLQPVKMQCKNLLISFLPPPFFASDYKLVWVRKGGQIKRLFIGCPFLFFPKGFFLNWKVTKAKLKTICKLYVQLNPLYLKSKPVGLLHTFSSTQKAMLARIYLSLKFYYRRYSNLVCHWTELFLTSASKC